MRTGYGFLGTIGIIISLGLLTGSGCPGPGGLGSVDELTDAEKQALAAGVVSTRSIVQGTDVTQSATQADDAREDGGQDVPFNTTFGTCPEVSIEGSIGDQPGGGTLAATLTIDFGSEPCDVYVFDDTKSLMCSGSATGTISLIDRQLDIVYDMLTCDDQSLDGSANLTFTPLNPGSSMSGEWNLTGTSGDDVVSIEGQGTASHIPAEAECCDVTRIDTFEGELRENDDEWSVSMTGVAVSYEQYGSHIPYSGSITVSGPDIRTFTITFDENSPMTGEVTLKVGNGPNFTVALDDLEEYSALISTE